MAEFDAFGTAVIIAMVVAYILLTSWLTVRLRSRTVDQFMTASHSLPAAVIGVLLMSEFIGAKSTVGTAQEAFVSGFAASWSVLGASIGFLLFGLFFVNCMTNNSREQLNREYSYPSIKQGPDAALHIAFAYFRPVL